MECNNARSLPTAKRGRYVLTCIAVSDEFEKYELSREDNRRSTVEYLERASCRRGGTCSPLLSRESLCGGGMDVKLPSRILFITSNCCAGSIIQGSFPCSILTSLSIDSWETISGQTLKFLRCGGRATARELMQLENSIYRMFNRKQLCCRGGMGGEDPGLANLLASTSTDEELECLMDTVLSKSVGIL